MVGYDAKSHLTKTDFAIAGGGSGFVTRAICQPLDVLKIRFQLQVEPISKSAVSKYRSIPQATVLITKEEGIKSLWKGHVPAQLLSISYGIAQFWTFEVLSKRAASFELSSKLSPLVNFSCGALSGCSATLVSFPFDVQNFRTDGREREDYRPMELETDIVSHAFGSARLRLANTDVLVAAKIEVDAPYPERPHEGKIEFFVDCSANATPNFEGRGGEALAVELSNSLTSAYKSPKAIDLKKLCILKGLKCWKLYIDILILECGGNLFDAASLAVKAALWDTKVPLVRSVNVDGSTVEMDVSDELYDCQRLDIRKAPIMVTVCKIGEQCIVDPNASEEQCSVGSVVVAVSDNKFTTVLQRGAGSLHHLTLKECLNLGLRVAERLDEALLQTLSQIQPNQDVGFLK